MATLPYTIACQKLSNKRAWQLLTCQKIYSFHLFSSNLNPRQCGANEEYTHCYSCQLSFDPSANKSLQVVSCVTIMHCTGNNPIVSIGIGKYHLPLYDNRNGILFLLFLTRKAGAITMSILSMVEAKLPPGFRFHPRDDELICDYLATAKVAREGTRSFHGSPMMVDVDLNKCEPWDLPAAACVGGKEWYFFSLRDRKYATGQRTNRATVSGYWKATGKDRPVARNGLLVGMRKTLVFYQGRAPKGKKTDWVMHEFRMEGFEAIATTSKFPFKEDWVLCKVFYKSRSISIKPSMESSHDDLGSQSQLPHLMDHHRITFDQTPLNLEGFRQVPCFSSLAQNLAPLSGLSQISGDRNVLRTVLNHLTKIEDNPEGQVVPNVAGGGSLVGYMAQGGLPSWSSF